MRKRVFVFLSCVMMVISLACGGGGGGTSTTPSPSPSPSPSPTTTQTLSFVQADLAGTWAVYTASAKIDRDGAPSSWYMTVNELGDVLPEPEIDNIWPRVAAGVLTLTNGYTGAFTCVTYFEISSGGAQERLDFTGVLGVGKQTMNLVLPGGDGVGNKEEAVEEAPGIYSFEISTAENSYTSTVLFNQVMLMDLASDGTVTVEDDDTFVSGRWNFFRSDLLYITVWFDEDGVDGADSRGEIVMSLENAEKADRAAGDDYSGIYTVYDEEDNRVETGNVRSVQLDTALDNFSLVDDLYSTWCLKGETYNEQGDELWQITTFFIFATDEISSKDGRITSGSIDSFDAAKGKFTITVNTGDGPMTVKGILSPFGGYSCGEMFEGEDNVGSLKMYNRQAMGMNYDDIPANASIGVLPGPDSQDVYLLNVFFDGDGEVVSDSDLYSIQGNVIPIGPFTYSILLSQRYNSEPNAQQFHVVGALNLDNEACESAYFRTWMQGAFDVTNSGFYVYCNNSPITNHSFATRFVNTLTDKDYNIVVDDSDGNLYAASDSGTSEMTNRDGVFSGYIRHEYTCDAINGSARCIYLSPQKVEDILGRRFFSDNSGIWGKTEDLLEQPRNFATGYSDINGNGTGRSVWRYHPIAKLPPIVDIASGYIFTLACCTDGSVWVWGNNDTNQLGGATGDDYSYMPLRVPSLASQNIKEVACDGFFALALNYDGEVFAWGNNYFGQLGTGDTNDVSVPTKIMALDGLPVQHIDAGVDTCYAIVGTGTVYAWGYNIYRQCSDDAVATVLIPQIVPGLPAMSAIDAGDSFCLGLDASGNVWAWGSNSVGQLGGNYPSGWGKGLADSFPTYNSCTSISACGAVASAIDTDGHLWIWGDNSGGQRGNGTADAGGYTATKVNGIFNFALACVGSYHVIALTTDGELLTWGSANYGGLGLGYNIEESSYPSTIDTIPEIHILLAGKSVSYYILRTIVP